MKKLFKVQFFIYLLVVSALLSCENQQSQEANLLIENETPLFLKVLGQSGWIIERDGASNNRTNSCQLGNASSFSCNGGNCVGSHDVDGHNFCVICDGGPSEGDMACTGSTGIVILIYAIADEDPAVKIKYTFNDSDGNVVIEGEGTVQDKAYVIGENLNANPELSLSIFVEE